MVCGLGLNSDSDVSEHGSLRLLSQIITMKTFSTKTFTKFLSAFRLQFRNINDMASVKRGRALVRVLVNTLPIHGLHTTSAKVISVVVFLRLVYHLFKHNGAKGACLTLKVYAVLLQQSIGGYVIRDLTELKFRVKRTRQNLPRVIPTIHRNMIRQGDTKMIKFYLTLFNLYRVIDFKGDLTLDALSKTIVSPAKEGQGINTLKPKLLAFGPIFFKWLSKEIGMNAKSLGREVRLSYENASAFPILKSSPFTKPLHKFSGLSLVEQREAMITKPVVSSHPLAIHEAANALNQSVELGGPTKFFLDLLPMNSELRKSFSWATRYPLQKGYGEAKLLKGEPILGKLSLKHEAAGKVRVFAMVDVWTQWLLKPLHDTIFDHILAGIAQDGTRDQMAPVYQLLKRCPSTLHSLDLSAATDRVPLWLQKAILGNIVGEDFAQNWGDFLTKRGYSLSFTGNDRRPVNAVLYYKVGQPMGALSSWAMLALSHHFIVQFCAHEAGYRGWFTAYAVLGDDLVIGNAKVAKMYLKVMRVLGVGIGLHKSLISADGSALEFAKRTLYKGVDVSPVPLTELKASFVSPASAVQFILKYGLNLASFLKVAGFGYRVLGNLHKPLGQLNSKVRLIILALNIPTTVEEVEQFFSIGAPRSGRALFETIEVINQMVNKEFKLLQRAVNALRLNLHTLEGKVLHAKDMARTLVTKLETDVIKVSAGTMELLDWAKAQLNNKTHLDHWVKGDGFIMSPVYLDALGQTFQAELDFADANPDLVLKGAERMYEAELIKDLLPLMKNLQELVQGASMYKSKLLLESIKSDLTRVMLNKYDTTAANLFMAYIALSKELANIPEANLQYARVVDPITRGFTDGVHIRLWKALSGLAQGTKKLPEAKAPEKDSSLNDPFGWFS